VVGVRASPGQVISTRSKHGTTWLQIICALLIFQSAELRAPLADLSPWPDWLVLLLDEVLRGLRGLRHRRFLKTHTPLDELALDRRVRYIVAARHPLDAAVSMYHQAENLNRRRLRQLIGESQPAGQARPRTRAGPTGCSATVQSREVPYARYLPKASSRPRLPSSRFGPSAQNWSKKTPCSTCVNRVPSSVGSNSNDATDVDM
jgi:hypothetical protein